MRKKMFFTLCAVITSILTLTTGWGHISTANILAAANTSAKAPSKDTATSNKTTATQTAATGTSSKDTGASSSSATTKSTNTSKTTTSSSKSSSSKTSSSKKIDVSKYLVYTIDDWSKGKKKVELFDNYYDKNPNTNMSVLSGQVYQILSKTTPDPVIMNVYEFTSRPDFAGKKRTITLSDKDLLPENLLKYNLQVGDTVITESFAYEQDGNIKNGKEPGRYHNIYII